MAVVTPPEVRGDGFVRPGVVGRGEGEKELIDG